MHKKNLPKFSKVSLVRPLVGLPQMVSLVGSLNIGCKIIRNIPWGVVESAVNSKMGLISGGPNSRIFLYTVIIKLGREIADSVSGVFNQLNLSWTPLHSG